jgi:hypothetical protein
MENNLVRQSGNNAGENIVGRDYVDNSITNHYPELGKFARLKELYSLFEKEKENNNEFKEFIEELQRYRTPKNEVVQGLTAKLIDGNRMNVIEFAEEVKDLYTRKLYANALYKSAQEINVFFLGLVWEYFTYSVYPLVCNDASEQEIGQAITQHISTPLQAALEGNTLGLTSTDINGMLYFLTGNCHIKWIKP